MQNEDVWLVVPLYDEGAVIADVVGEARSVFPKIVCVDDGSRDDSADRAEQAGAAVVRHPVNLGQGAALQTGFEFALGDPTMRYVVTYDADGQHQIHDVEVMVDRVRQGDVRVVFGSRFLDERTEASALKKLVLRAAVAYTNVTTGTRLTYASRRIRPPAATATKLRSPS